MPKYTRGEFLGFGALLVGAAGAGLGPREAVAQGRSATVGERPDLALINGKVYTVDAAGPRAEAFAMKNGRIVAVGSNDEIENVISPETEVIDAGDMTVTPEIGRASCRERV